MLGVLPAPSPAVKDIRITTQDDLPGPDGDEPYTLFVNQTEYGNARPQEVHGAALSAGGQAPCRCHRAWGRCGGGLHGVPGAGAAADLGVQRPAPRDGGLPSGAGGGDRDPAAAARQPGSGAGIWVRREALGPSPWRHRPRGHQVESGHSSRVQQQVETQGCHDQTHGY